jgi:hypothetical protein
VRLKAEELLIFKREADTLLEDQEKESMMEMITSCKEEGTIGGEPEFGSSSFAGG